MPTFTQTAKYALRWLTGANVISDIDAGFQALAEDVDSKFAGISAGPLASRPTSSAGTPGIVGRFYLATDTGQVFIDNGTGWIEFPLTPATVPTATILAYGAASAPSGYLACDGSAVDRTTYAGLFAVIGTTHGAGNGTSTFNVPDLRGRTAVGAGSGAGLTARTLGSTFGEESHALSVAELAAHNHGGATGNASKDLNHTHTGTTGGENSSLAHNHYITSGHYPVPMRTGGSVWQSVPVSSGLDYVVPSAMVNNVVSEDTGTSTSGPAAHTHNITTAGPSFDLTTHTHSVASQGSGQAHNNVQPSTAVSFIIKT